RCALLRLRRRGLLLLLLRLLRLLLLLRENSALAAADTVGARRGGRQRLLARTGRRGGSRRRSLLLLARRARAQHRWQSCHGDGFQLSAMRARRGAAASGQGGAHHLTQFLLLLRQTLARGEQRALQLAISLALHLLRRFEHADELQLLGLHDAHFVLRRGA